MAAKKSKKKDSRKGIKKAEHEYLKKLEEAVTGKSGDSPYIVTPEDTKKESQLKRLRQVDNLPTYEPVPPKGPQRIPIEWAIGEEKRVPQVPPPVKEAQKPKAISIEEIIEEPLTPTPIPPISPEVSEPEPKPKPQPQREPQPVLLGKPKKPLRVRPPEPPPPPKPKLLYDLGTIMKLEDGSIGVYKGPMTGKEYHLIYHLRPDGTIRPEGIYIYAYRSEALGLVNKEVLEDMQRSMRWERDRIVEHLSSQEKARLIPLLSPKVIKKEVSEPARKRDSLERGRRLHIRFGDRIWDAVYWGSDELGQIVAHNTNKVWRLMHLNLGRFGDSLKHGDLLSSGEIKDINDSLSETIFVGD